MAGHAAGIVSKEIGLHEIFQRHALLALVVYELETKWNGTKISA